MSKLPLYTYTAQDIQFSPIINEPYGSSKRCNDKESDISQCSHRLQFNCRMLLPHVAAAHSRLAIAAQYTQTQAEQKAGHRDRRLQAWPQNRQLQEHADNASKATAAADTRQFRQPTCTTQRVLQHAQPTSCDHKMTNVTWAMSSIRLLQDAVSTTCLSASSHAILRIRMTSSA